MRTHAITTLLIAPLACLAGLTAGCGEFIRQDRAPVTLVINSLVGVSGSTGDSGGTLNSDVVTIVEGNSSLFSDSATVTMSSILKNQGSPTSPISPTPTNAVTITRYRIVFSRTDGRNTPGVDVPHPFDSATTFTVPAGGTASQGFELIRHTAKIEAPLATLATSQVIISTIADITFFGRDQAGNDVSVTGRMGIQFGNFADPE